MNSKEAIKLIKENLGRDFMMVDSDGTTIVTIYDEGNGYATIDTVRHSIEDRVLDSDYITEEQLLEQVEEFVKFLIAIEVELKEVKFI